MRYRIVYDKPGRLRVRYGPDQFSPAQGYGIARLLMDCADILKVSACSVNGSILVVYKGEGRAQALALLSERSPRSFPEAEPRDADQTDELDNGFFQKVARMSVWHLFKKMLPAPIRIGITLYNAMGCWRVGVHSLMQGKLNVSVLDAASIGAAVFQRDFKTASTVMFLLKLSEHLEDYTRKRTQTALIQSLAINVDTVWRVSENGEETAIPTAQLREGECVRVRSGSLIPVDGVVSQGDAMINEASMTGESLPVHKGTGSAVYAGTVIEEGNVVIRVTALAEKSRIQQIVDLVENSESLKASTQSRAEHLADAIVPFSFLGALLVGGLTRSLTKGLSVLMVDYSCAIKLSTPIAVISAMREASTRRMMVKGGKFLEEFAEADTIVFDKTGTLTAACPKVEQVLDFTGRGEEEILRIAACIEEHFPHSMARAVTRAAEEKQLRHREEHAEVKYVVAHGVATELHGRRALIGSRHFIFEDEGISCTPEQEAEIEAAAHGRSVLYLSLGDALAGVLLISDPPRPEAAEAVRLLRGLGINRMIMLTGDQEAAAKEVCHSLGIDDYRAQVLPADKASIIEQLRREGRRVIMVGDGVNDSPALAAANVSVAMKDASDLAREVADITLLSSDLRELSVLRRLSTGMLSRIGLNYKLILIINSLLLGCGIAGWLTPGAVALLHNASTMGISAGSMRPYLEREENKLLTVPKWLAKLGDQRKTTV